jgi:hypothetical protein
MYALLFLSFLYQLSLEFIYLPPTPSPIPLILEEACHHWALAAIMAGILTTGEYNWFAKYPGNPFAPGVCQIPIIHRVRCCERGLFDVPSLPILEATATLTSSPSYTPVETPAPTPSICPQGYHLAGYPK